MNRKNILYILGKLLGAEAVILCIPMVVAIYYREDTVVSFLITSAILMILSILCTIRKPTNRDIYAKEGFVIVAFVWIIWSVFGALPYYLSGSIPAYIDALFETISGFTTTGSTILNDIEALPKSLLFWRSFTHWLGGMGVLVFVLAVMPLSDGRSIHLLKAEMTGPSVGKLEPKARQTAKLLYKMYIALTILQIIFLLFGGMGIYDSVIHAFSTAGTGGFSNKNLSVGYYNSAYIEGVIGVFMILFGVNFNIFYFLIVKRMFSILKNEELFTYLGMIAVSTIAITINTAHMYESFAKSFRYASFQVASIMTSTGFMTYDYNQWPEFSKTIIMLLMICGACAGSTGGGIKISRVLIVFKVIKKEIKKILHPRLVTDVKIDNRAVSHETVNGVFLYFMAYAVILVTSTILISLNNFDFATNFSSVLTMLNNIGPGISQVGPTENFAMFSNFSKLVFSADMLLGRLEIIPFLVLCSPAFWKKKF